MKKLPNFHNNSNSPVKKSNTLYMNTKRTIYKGNSTDFIQRNTLYNHKIKSKFSDFFIEHQNNDLKKKAIQLLNSKKLRYPIQLKNGKGNYDKNLQPSKVATLLEERRKKKQSQQKDDQSLHKIYRKSFTIKQIHPQPKQLLPKGFYENKNLESMFGSYYQVVAVQKKFDYSHYSQKTQQTRKILSNPQSKYQIKDRYQGRIRPQNRNMIRLKNQKKNLFSFDGHILEPWNNLEESAIEQMNQN